MDNITKSIQEKQAEIKLNILKGFSDFDETFEKAKTYSDNTVNKKLGRAGKTYGKDESEEKDSKPDSNEDEKSVKEYAASTSTEDLKKYVKKNPKGEHVNEAKAELTKRK